MMQITRFYFRWIALLTFLITFGVKKGYTQYTENYFRIGVSGGATTYLGELSPDFNFQTNQPGFGLDLTYRINPMFSVKGGYYKGVIEAWDADSNDPDQLRRNLNVRTEVDEFHAILVADFFFNQRSYVYRPIATPYLFAGLAFFKFDPQGRYRGRWFSLQPLGTEGQYLPDPNDVYPEPYKLVQMAIPFGVGFRFKIARDWDLELETGWRKIFTDYLDDVSSYYPDRRSLRKKNELAAIFSDRSDPIRYPEGLKEQPRGQRANNDWYIYTSISINYILDPGSCPSPRRRR